MTWFGFLIFVCVSAVACSLMLVNAYNELISLKNQLERACSNIDVVLNQCHDELSYLIQLVEDYAPAEKIFLGILVSVQTQCENTDKIEDKMQIANQMGPILLEMTHLGEVYPELKANEFFVQYKTNLIQLENLIADRRDFYNEVVLSFNNQMKSMPGALVARVLKYQPQNLFVIQESHSPMNYLSIDTIIRKGA